MLNAEFYMEVINLKIGDLFNLDAMRQELENKQELERDKEAFLKAKKEECVMFGNKIKLSMTHDEIRVLVYALNELRNALIDEGRYTDAVDELLIKLLG